MNEKDIDMQDPKTTFEEAYKKLKTDFMKRLNTHIDSINNVLEKYEQNACLTKDDLHYSQRFAHYLSGSGTTFGFPDITAQGRRADIYLDKTIKAMPDGETLVHEDFETLEPLLKNLRASCSDALSQDRPDALTDAVIAKDIKAENIPKATEHILIIDDDKDMADLLSVKFRSKNMHVSTARNGASALDLIAQEKPDLIILDIIMPEMSGHEVLQKLKEDPDLASIPVIMLTGQTQRKDVVSALYTGAIDYAVKPVDIDKLVARCEKILESRRYTVMIVDNDQLILQLLNSRYKTEGYNVILANDGKEGWQKIHKKLPDLVILDRMLPGMEGLAILKNMRDEESTKDIPVIILSARSAQRDIDISLKMGAQSYITKPFIPSELVTKGYKLIKLAQNKKR